VSGEGEPTARAETLPGVERAGQTTEVDDVDRERFDDLVGHLDPGHPAG
jgi:hypothetical protein